MTDFEIGDRVRYVGEFSAWLKGMEGTVTGVLSSTYKGGSVDVRWDSETPGSNPFGVFKSNIEKIEPVYDQHTVNAIVTHLREGNWFGVAVIVESVFAVPKTRTVTVNFQVPEDESVADYLENVGIDYDIE